ncbi:immunity 49 family protein [Tenacibaculum finnmarkense]|uniref:immunity 49 family protein n=1 Tax=Tenacibaculum finnmarkense TaxID=2781243 RepID=UPI001EFB72E5|nr:immunity 49 family protein [Tenacibaculum finnmarkense]MCG8208437.1 immunity 49 family protein [Tenacibaculum finnmarkense genomovar finnmarkense]MCG8724380.1 immunity 49 family protein [Tenacibaculum finnmarkense]MCG8742694.1 immunity 49 family protein [Tenacibaculum finnmarkense]MCG8766077.1 immunity 49 family protein [Tenacibaculum finnmarkense]MCG8779056.1 immunity 49 family protein [Tenacibaculum finnmarkense]
MINIERHKLDALKTEYYIEDLMEQYDRLENKVIPAYKVNTDKYDLGIMTFYTLDDIARYNLVLEEEQDRKLQTEVLFLWQYISKAFYSLAYGAGREVTINLKEENFRHQGIAYKSDMGFGSWLKAYSAFRVMRDNEGLEILNNITEDAMSLGDWNKMEKNMLYYFANIGQGNYHELEKYLIPAIKSTSADSGDFEINSVSVEYNMYIYEPLLFVYEALLRNDEAEFNKQIEEALNRYKQFYDKKVKNRIVDGWMSWLILAPVSMAYDLGIKINVKSDYIPEWLYKAEFNKPHS